MYDIFAMKWKYGTKKKHVVTVKQGAVFFVVKSNVLSRLCMQSLIPAIHHKCEAILRVTFGTDFMSTPIHTHPYTHPPTHTPHTPIHTSTHPHTHTCTLAPVTIFGTVGVLLTIGVEEVGMAVGWT